MKRPRWSSQGWTYGVVYYCIFDLEITKKAARVNPNSLVAKVEGGIFIRIGYREAKERLLSCNGGHRGH